MKSQHQTLSSEVKEVDVVLSLLKLLGCLEDRNFHIESNVYIPFKHVHNTWYDISLIMVKQRR